MLSPPQTQKWWGGGCWFFFCCKAFAQQSFDIVPMRWVSAWSCFSLTSISFIRSLTVIVASIKTFFCFVCGQQENTHVGAVKGQWIRIISNVTVVGRNADKLCPQPALLFGPHHLRARCSPYLQLCEQTNARQQTDNSRHIFHSCFPPKCLKDHQGSGSTSVFLRLRSIPARWPVMRDPSFYWLFTLSSCKSVTNLCEVFAHL